MQPTDYETRPALFCDLDGTLRRHHVNLPVEQELYEGVEETLSRWHEAGYLVFVITNQGAVAHGNKTVESLQDEFKAFLELFDDSSIIESIVWTGTHPHGHVPPYGRRSMLHKPHTGMITVAENEAIEQGYILDYERSLFVGDQMEDNVCAEKADIPFIYATDFRDGEDYGYLD